MSRIVTLGHVDSGKSTLLGHLAKQLSEQGQAMSLPYAQRGDELGKSSFRFAFAFDNDRGERERGITIHPNKFAYLVSSGITLVDAPGHRDFWRGQCICASHADTALLVVTADYNLESELAVYRVDGFMYTGGVDQACRVIRGFGIRRVIVAVNKLDSQNCSKDPAARFLEVQERVKKQLAKWKIGGGGDYSTTTHREFPFPFRLRMRTLLLVALRLRIVLPKDIKVMQFAR
jgi:translation elongation factor EF-1alpha